MPNPGQQTIDNNLLEDLKKSIDKLSRSTNISNIIMIVLTVILVILTFVLVF